MNTNVRKRFKNLESIIRERGVSFYNPPLAEENRQNYITYLKRYTEWLNTPLPRASLKKWWKATYAREEFPARIAEPVSQYLFDLAELKDDKVGTWNREQDWKGELRDLQEEDWRRKWGL